MSMLCHSSIGRPAFAQAEIREAAESGRLLALDVDLCMAATDDREPLSPERLVEIVGEARALGARRVLVRSMPDDRRLLAIVDAARELGLEADVCLGACVPSADDTTRLAEHGAHVAIGPMSADQEASAVTALQSAGYGPGGLPFAVCEALGEPSATEAGQRLAKMPIVEMGMTPGEACAQGLRLRGPLSEGRDVEPYPPLGDQPCQRHQYAVLVSAQGQVYACVGIDLVIGDLRDSTLAKVLENSEVIEDLRAHTEHIKGPCAACDRAEHCYGCRASAYRATGDYLESDPSCWRNAERLDELVPLPVSSAGLIPHGPEMCLVDALLAVGDRSAEVETRVRDGMPFLGADGQLERAAYVEIMAQAAALHHGYRCRHLQSETEGFLIGARKVRIHEDVRLGETLRIHLRKGARLGDFGIIEGRIYRGGHLIAEGEIKIFHRQVEAS